MQVTISSRHFEISGSTRGYCEEKAGRLIRYYDRVQSIEVVLDGTPGRHLVEMIVHLDGHAPLVATEEHTDLLAAVDLNVDKLERQLTRLKEKQRNRKHPPPTPKDLAE
jgi:putative sigma-54 modulation protein